MKTWTLINRIGAQLGVSPALRWHWRRRGVPYKWHLAICREAEKRGIVLDAAMLRQRFLKQRRRPS